MTAKHDLKDKTYNLCAVHGTLIDMYEHVLSEEQKDNKSSENDPDEKANCTNDIAFEKAKLDSLSDEGKRNTEVDNTPSDARIKALRGEFLVEPLSEAEVSKGPAVTNPWSSDIYIDC